MTGEGTPDIAALIAAWNNGEEAARERLISAVYPELRRIARFQLNRRSAGHSQDSVALANEACVQLREGGNVPCETGVHFLALCAQMIRQSLVKQLRPPAVLADAPAGSVDQPQDDVDLVALDTALEALAKMDDRKARVVELRYFGGLSIEDTAEILGIPVETAGRDWKMAKAWLYAELTSGRR